MSRMPPPDPTQRDAAPPQGRNAPAPPGGDTFARAPGSPPAAPLPWLWLHATTPAGTGPLTELAFRLLGERDDICVILTHPAGAPPGMEHPRLSAQPDPTGDAAELGRMLDRTRPAAALFTGAPLPTAALNQTAARAIPVTLANAGRPDLPKRWGLLRPSARGAVSRLDRIFTVSEPAATAWHRLGASRDMVRAIGRMADSPGALLCNEAEHDALAADLHLRPVWLAVGTPEAEEEAVLSAHLTALRLSHRLLLILHPDDPQRGAALHSRLAESFDVALRSRDDPIDSATQIYIADTGGERGLWYRLAQVTYMGGTSGRGGSAFDPMEAASLGSALLFGPETRRFADSYSRLTKTRAARALPPAAPARIGKQLGQAVSDMLEPETAAQFAAAAWDVVSEGSEATDTVMAHLLWRLDTMAAGA